MKKKVSELIKLPPIDQSAETCGELAEAWGMRFNAANLHLKRLMEEGRIEKVRKKVGNRMIPAYRTVK